MGTNVGRKRIGLESNLSGLGDLLNREGYEVVAINPLSTTGDELRNVDAVVLTGADNNLMGMEDIKTRVPVIQAEGRTPEEILSSLKERLF